MNNGTVHEDVQYVLLLRVADKKFSENQNIHFVSNNFCISKKHSIYEIMWENMAESDRPQMDNTTHAHCMLDT